MGEVMSRAVGIAIRGGAAMATMAAIAGYRISWTGVKAVFLLSS